MAAARRLTAVVAAALAVSPLLAGIAPTRAATTTASPIPTISTIAGGGSGNGVATAYAQEPHGLALFGTTLYVADTKGLVVRALDLTTGKQKVVAGLGVLGFSGDGGPATAAALYPGAITVGRFGNLYIADTVNNRVRAIDGQGVIRTIAGTGVGGFAGDGGPAIQAELAGPEGLAFDTSGNLYIADTGNWRIRKVTPAGVITTIAGNGVRAETGDGGLATAASLEPPNMVAVDLAGNVYFDGSRRIRRVAALTGIITTFAGTGAGGDAGDGGPATSASIEGPNGLAVDDGGNVYLTTYWSVRKIDTTGTIRRVVGDGSRYGPYFAGDGGPALSARLQVPTGVVAAGSGWTYIADSANARVRAVDPAGTIHTIAGNGSLAIGGDGGPALQAQLGGPRGVAADAAGNVYVLDTYVRRIDPSGTITAFAGTPDNPGNQFSGDGGPATAAGLSGPSDVATDGAGNVYIAENYSNRIRRVGTDGIITTIAGYDNATGGGGSYSGDGGPATEAGLFWPGGVAADAAGSVYISDSRNNRIRKVGTDGVITTIAGTGAASSSGDGGPASSAAVNDPQRIEVDRFGNIYFSEFPEGRVRRIDTSGSITTVAVVGAGGVQGLAVDSAGILYFSKVVEPNAAQQSSWQMQVIRVEPSGALTVLAGGDPGYAGDGGPAVQGRFFYPYDIAIDAAGHIDVADGLNRRIRQISGAATTKAVADDAARYEARAYPDLLGRQPTAAELAFWTPYVVTGLPREWLAGALVTSQEFRLLVAVATYQKWLGRAPTVAEATTLANRIGAGLTIEQAWAEVAGSDESWARLGKDPGAYVDRLYDVAFGRPADDAGRALWVDKLSHGFSRETAALAFALNPEGSTHTVTQFYTRYLHRQPDAVGLNAWVSLLQTGFRTEWVMAFFVGSAEYSALAS